MIFDKTHRLFFERSVGRPLYNPTFGVCAVSLTAVATRTGQRAVAYRAKAPADIRDFESFSSADAVEQLVECAVDAVCIATPNDRHFAAAKLAIEARKHVLIDNPSVLRLAEPRSTAAACQLVATYIRD